MKPRCPIGECGRDMGQNRVLCDDHWSQLPEEMRDEVATTWTLVRKAKKANLQQATLRKHRQAKTRAILFVIDRAKAVPA